MTAAGSRRPAFVLCVPLRVGLSIVGLELASGCVDVGCGPALRAGFKPFSSAPRPTPWPTPLVSEIPTPTPASVPAPAAQDGVAEISGVVVSLGEPVLLTFTN